MVSSFGYLSYDEERYLKLVEQDLCSFCTKSSSNRVLIFPPLPSRFRFLTHELIKRWPELKSCSIGSEPGRRTVVYFQEKAYKAQVLMNSGTQEPEQASKCIIYSRGRGRGMKHSPTASRRPAQELYIPGAFNKHRKNPEAQEENPTSSNKLPESDRGKKTLPKSATTTRPLKKDEKNSKSQQEDNSNLRDQSDYTQEKRLEDDDVVECSLKKLQISSPSTARNGLDKRKKTKDIDSLCFGDHKMVNVDFADHKTQPSFIDLTRKHVNGTLLSTDCEKQLIEDTVSGRVDNVSANCRNFAVGIKTNSGEKQNIKDMSTVACGEFETNSLEPCLKTSSTTQASNIERKADIQKKEKLPKTKTNGCLAENPKIIQPASDIDVSNTHVEAEMCYHSKISSSTVSDKKKMSDCEEVLCADDDDKILVKNNKISVDTENVSGTVETKNKGKHQNIVDVEIKFVDNDQEKMKAQDKDKHENIVDIETNFQAQNKSKHENIVRNEERERVETQDKNKNESIVDIETNVQAQIKSRHENIVYNEGREKVKTQDKHEDTADIETQVEDQTKSKHEISADNKGGEKGEMQSDSKHENIVDINIKVEDQANSKHEIIVDSEEGGEKVETQCKSKRKSKKEEKAKKKEEKLKKKQVKQKPRKTAKCDDEKTAKEKKSEVNDGGKIGKRNKEVIKSQHENDQLKTSNELKNYSHHKSATSNDDQDVNQKDKMGNRTESSEGDDWEAAWDDAGECLDETLLAELKKQMDTTNMEVVKPQYDYLSFKPNDIVLDNGAFDHVVEIYDFSSEFKTHDLINLLSNFKQQDFQIQWVDDTHALAVFSNHRTAQQAIEQGSNPMVKLRPLCEGTQQSKLKAKRNVDVLQPYKERPKTTKLVANRLVTGALGMRSKMSLEERRLEREKIKAERERKQSKEKQKKDLWESDDL